MSGQRSKVTVKCDRNVTTFMMHHNTHF